MGARQAYTEIGHIKLKLFGSDFLEFFSCREINAALL